jgi:superfamily II DNA/RNA helicase
MNFKSLGLDQLLLTNLDSMGFQRPTTIQMEVIPCFFRNQDILASAQTGTGKTGAFLIPIIESLLNLRRRSRMPRAIILEPTRELAIQVYEQFLKIAPNTNLTALTLVGGESMVLQERMISRGVDVIIATPGRLMDLCEKSKLLLLDIKTLVLDEADRMLDMGFIPDVERLVSLIPQNRQTVLLSATFDEPIEKLAQSFLINPVRISVDPETKTAITITQHLVQVRKEVEKRTVLRQILNQHKDEQIIVFCNRKKDANILFKSCQRHKMKVGLLHGDMSQGERNETLENFKAQTVTIMIASNVAARGIDVSDLSVVINFDVPNMAEDYVHRIGRTGRAGKTGIAYTLALPSEKKFVKAVEALIDCELQELQLAPAPKEEKKKFAPRYEGELEPAFDSDEPVIGFGALMPDFIAQEITYEFSS